METETESTLNEWRLLIEEKKKSSLMIKEFCQLKNITPAKYYYYHKKLNERDKLKTLKTASNITPIQIVNKVAQEPTAIRFILPNNLQCILPSTMPLQEIKSILELIMSC